MHSTAVSLLDRLRQAPDEASWDRLVKLYRPLILQWLQKDPTLHDEAEDLAQEVLVALVKELPTFERQRTGSFRRWLGEITHYRLLGFWRDRRNRARPEANLPAESVLAGLADPNSALSRQWDQDHDRHVVARGLELIKGDFSPTTWRAFRAVVFEERKPADVAAELGLTPNAVMLAKSHVLKRLREEIAGLLD